MDDELARSPRALPAEAASHPELDAAARDLLRNPEVRRIVTFIREDDHRTLEEQVRLASTPAPPFQEEERGRLMASLMRESGTAAPETDEVGNVRAWVGPFGPRPLVVAAHLDTVFSREQEITIRQEGDRWVGPGISDDARGLAALLSLVRALSRYGGRLEIPVLVVGTVGEEGVGDLRGVRHLFGEGGRLADARGFISLDGAGSTRVIASGVGSRRFRAEVRGPGGHSWVDWGRVNPLQILASAAAAMGRLPLPEGATFNLGRMGGGTSINAIPTGGWMELELRSEDEAALKGLEEKLREILDTAVREANAAPDIRAGEEAQLEVDRIGYRPAGVTDPATPLVEASVAATRAVSGRAELAASSTDANYPMLRGIPAITLGAGGEAGLAHTPQEWYRNVKGPEGVLRAFLTLLLLERFPGG